MTYKLLVVDVDGTLLNGNNTISEEDKKTLREVRRLGTPVSLCTGRVNQACQNVLKELSLDGYHIFADGALVSSADNRQQIYAKTIDDSLVREMVAYVHDKGINTIDFFSPTRHFIEKGTAPWYIDIRRNFFGLKPTVVDFSELFQEKIIKATFAIATSEDRTKADGFLNHFQERLSFSWTGNATYPQLDFINIIDPRVSKAEAMRVLASYLGVSLSEVVAIGDGHNDIPLLAHAGLAIAMGNAPDELKELAHYVTLSVEESGLSKAVKKFLL